MITIVDYGMGNLGSIRNMLKKIGAESIITSSAADVAAATKLILPGVGAFDNAMTNLNNLGLIEPLNHKVLVEKTPILGICLGMQLLTKSSEEGKLRGFGWIDAETRKFSFEKLAERQEQLKLKIPHMGWNTVNFTKPSCPLVSNLPLESRFYFVHSYHVCLNNPEDSLTTTRHGYDFVSSVNHSNIYGAQYHPEKSHKFGLKLLTNFVHNC